jgi:hypothetical protein
MRMLFQFINIATTSASAVNNPAHCSILTIVRAFIWPAGCHRTSAYIYGTPPSRLLRLSVWNVNPKPPVLATAPFSTDHCLPAIAPSRRRDHYPHNRPGPQNFPLTLSFSPSKITFLQNLLNQRNQRNQRLGFFRIIIQIRTMLSAKHEHATVESPGNPGADSPHSIRLRPRGDNVLPLDEARAGTTTKNSKA